MGYGQQKRMARLNADIQNERTRGEVYDRCQRLLDQGDQVKRLEGLMIAAVSAQKFHLNGPEDPIMKVR